MRQKQAEPASRDDIWLVFVSPEDGLLDGAKQEPGTRCRIMAHEKKPAFYVFANGKRIKDLDPHDVLHAMASDRLTFLSRRDKELFAGVLTEKLRDSERQSGMLSAIRIAAVSVVAAGIAVTATAITVRKALTGR